MNRKLPQFSIRVLFGLVLACSLVLMFWPTRPVQVPAPLWREILFEGSETLKNIPRVTSCDGNFELNVTIKNVGSTTLLYRQYNGEQLQLFRENHDGTEWIVDGYDDETGMITLELKPSQSVQAGADFWHKNERERVLTMFSEKNTDRRGLVVLGQEPTNRE